MEHDKLVIKGARENNLKNIDIEIPKNKLVIMTGLSGSGCGIVKCLCTPVLRKHGKTGC